MDNLSEGGSVMETVLAYLPSDVADKIKEFPDYLAKEIEEIRLRVNRPLEIFTKGKAYFSSYFVTQVDAEQFIHNLANHSFYTLEEELKKGYITIAGGHRVGLAGRVILEKGEVKALRDFSSFNIRIAKEKIGVANPFITYLIGTKWLHTMIIGAPQTGKTTFLRDLARLISTGVPERNIPPQKVGIVDERSEICGCVRGVPQLQFGPRLDVLDACPKAEGMMMLIRSMSPDVLIVDEVGRREDSEAIMEAVHAGITLVMTTHGDSFEDIRKRPILKDIFHHHVFDRFIELSRKNGKNIIKTIRNKEGIMMNSMLGAT